MDKKIKALFDYQKNEKLDAIIEKTRESTAKDLDFDELDFVNAAGDGTPDEIKVKIKTLDGDNDEYMIPLTDD